MPKKKIGFQRPKRASSISTYIRKLTTADAKMFQRPKRASSISTKFASNSPQSFAKALRCFNALNGLLPFLQIIKGGISNEKNRFNALNGLLPFLPISINTRRLIWRFQRPKRASSISTQTPNSQMLWFIKDVSTP